MIPYIRIIVFYVISYDMTALDIVTRYNELRIARVLALAILSTLAILSLLYLQS
jgi:hypothetical protein